MKTSNKKTKKEFKLKDAIFVFISFAFICMAILFIFTVYDILTIHQLLSFENPIRIVITICITSFMMLLWGIVLTYYTPSKYIDDTNKSYQEYSLINIISFMFVGALFEELLFRGIVQNTIFLFTDNQWIAVITTTVLFLGFHVQYLKKPIMLLNISVPSLVFGWIYVETNNIFVPVIVHFIMNIGITLLLKYNLIKMKQ